MQKAVEKSQTKLTSAKTIFRRLGVLLGFIIFLNIFFFHQIGSLAVGLFLLGSFLFLVLLRLENIKLLDKKVVVVFAGALIFFSSIIVSRTFPPVQLLAFLSGLALLVLFSLYSLTTEKFWHSAIDLFAAPFLAFGSYLLGVFHVLSHSLDGKISELLPVKKETVSLLRLKSLVIGGIVGLVVIGIFIPLLSADPVFGTFLKQINISESVSREVFRVILSVVVLLIFLPLVYALTIKFSSDSVEKKALSFSFGSEVGVVSVLVAILFAIYLILAWPYLFVSVPTELHLSQIGVATYSEYVRKGFGEFLVAAALLYGVLCAGVVALRSAGGKSRLLQIANSVVFVEFILFVFSILRRVLLYQDYHGLSVVRIYGSIFLILVVLLGGTLIARRLWKSLGGFPWVTVEVVIVGVTVLFVTFFNVSQFLLLNPPTVNKRVDYVYLSRMSADGYDGWKLAYQNAKKTLDETSKQDFVDREDRREVAYAGIITSQLLQNYSFLVNRYGSGEEKKEFSKAVCSENKQQVELCLKKDPEIDLVNYAAYIPTFDVNFYNNGTFYLVTEVDKRKSAIDKILTFNLGEKDVFEKMKVEIPIKSLLGMQRKYFEIFKKVASQPENERGYEFDISLSSPLIRD